MPADKVARAVVTAVQRGQRSVVLPRVVNVLLLGDALSPRLGDLMVSALTVRPVARLLGLNGGETFHQTISRAA